MSQLELDFVKFSHTEAEKLNKLALCFLQREFTISGRVAVKLVSRKEIKTLNQNYASENKATDVLSFSYIEDKASEEENLGDIVICEPIAKKQAKEHNNQPIDEYAFLLVHGLLHIFGFDHVNEEGQREMETLQEEIMKCGGFAERAVVWQ